MQIKLGYDALKLSQQKTPEESEVNLDFSKLINGHILLVGKSGSGKTYTLRQLLEQIITQTKGKSFRAHIIDVHGDIEIDGASSVKFSESTDFGFNPLVINPDPDYGGVRKRIQSFISSLNRTGFKLGGNQEASLRNLLLDLYAANGIYEKDPSTWKQKSPAVDDLARFTKKKMKMMFLGLTGKGNGNSCAQLLEKLNKEQAKLFRKLKAYIKSSGEEQDVANEELQKSKDKIIELFSEYVTNIETGHELDDLLKYDSLDVIKSLNNKIDNLNSIGIFKNQKPKFDPQANIWRYDIKALDKNEQALFVSFLCESLFFRAVQRGMQDDLIEIIILDEAHQFINEDPSNPINMIMKEARKFGLGMWAASQSPTHFSDDFISNVSAKIILGIDQTFWDSSVRKLKVTLDALQWIIFHKRILVQMNNIGDVKSDFLRVYKELPKRGVKR